MMRNTEELREAIARARNGQSRWRCPTELREEVVSHSKARRSAGESVVEIARSLGLSESGVNRWLQKATGTLRPVRVQASPPESDRLILVTPSGYRLEGLSMTSAVDLLRRLGC